MPEGTVFMEPGHCGAMDLVLSFLSTLHCSTSALQHSVCAAQLRWKGLVSLCPAGKKISCTSDTSCVSEPHPDVLHLHSSTHIATKITAIPVHQLGQHIFLPVVFLDLQSIILERLFGST